jgi:hypothetical protein
MGSGLAKPVTWNALDAKGLGAELPRLGTYVVLAFPVRMVSSANRSSSKLL